MGSIFLSLMDVLEGGLWLIRNNPLLLNVRTPSTLLRKHELKTLPVWIKIHHVPLVAYTEDGLSMLATKIGEPKILDAYTAAMCSESWGRSSYARTMIEVSADQEFKEEISMAIPNLEEEEYYKAIMEVEYEFKPTRCETCCVFGHSIMKCPKTVHVSNTGAPIDKDGFQEVDKKKKATKLGVG